jgi:CelD/BcsL family acetyltransferase involved in cellulose biosynthesis
MILRASALNIDRNSDFDALCAPYHASVFQKPLWLRCWFETLGDTPRIEGYWISVVDALETPILALPLIRWRNNQGLILSNVAPGLSDYNAPLIVPELAAKHSCGALWAAIRSALPKADLLILAHMPTKIGPLANPLLAHPLAINEGISSWNLPLPETLAAYRATLSPSMRHQMAKAMRRFGRLDGAAAKLATSAEDVRDILDFLDQSQIIRLAEKGDACMVENPDVAHFYRHLAQTGFASGKVRMTHLQAEGRLLAANFALYDDKRVYLIRIASLRDQWAPFKLGLLASQRLIEHAIEDKAQVFDFTIGDYDFKRRFGAAPEALYELTLPLTWRGWLPALIAQMKRRLRPIQSFLKSKLAR